MTIDQIGFYNGALDHCGETALSGLTEERGPRYLLDRVWANDPIKYALEQGQWQYATRTLRLEADPGIEPDFGYRYAFQHPVDYCGTTAISTDEFFNEPLNAFADEAGYWYADVPILYVKIISDDVDYGRNLTLMSQSFIEYIFAFMAGKIIPRLVNSRSTRADMEAIMEKMLSSAQGKDGRNRPVRQPPRGTWVNSRHGRNSSFNRERR